MFFHGSKTFTFCRIITADVLCVHKQTLIRILLLFLQPIQTQRVGQGSLSYQFSLFNFHEGSQANWLSGSEQGADGSILDSFWRRLGQSQKPKQIFLVLIQNDRQEVTKKKEKYKKICRAREQCKTCRVVQLTFILLKPYSINI